MESLDLFTVYLLYNKTKFIQGISASFLCEWLKAKNKNIYIIYIYI